MGLGWSFYILSMLQRISFFNLIIELHYLWWKTTKFGASQVLNQVLDWWIARMSIFLTFDPNRISFDIEKYSGDKLKRKPRKERSKEDNKNLTKIILPDPAQQWRRWAAPWWRRWRSSRSWCPSTWTRAPARCRCGTSGK